MTPVVYNLSGIRQPLTGVGRYAVELIRETQNYQPSGIVVKNGRLYHEQDLLELLLQLDLAQSGSDRSGSPAALSFSSRARQWIGSVPLSRSFYRALDQYRFANLSNALTSSGALVHDLNYSLPPRARRVSTVYDLSHILCPDTHPRHRVHYLRAYFDRLCASQANIIAISNSVKMQMIEHYGIDDQRISVTHLAASDAFKPRNEMSCQAVLSSYSLEFKGYVLCVATLEPRKNLVAVLDAYQTLDAQTQAQFPLVMVGGMGWKSSALAHRIQHLHDAGVVKHIGFVPQSVLPELYSGARAFVYPSLYEGFGLPVLEAMQSGCPCITSSAGALAEVSAEHAIQVDPMEYKDIAHALHLLLHNDKENARYTGLGLTRAAQFTWTKTARATCQIYDKL